VGPEKRTGGPPDRAVTAVHEAGHAVIAHLLGHAVIRASLDGVRTRYRHGDLYAYLCEAAIALAGPLAEQHYRPTTKAERRELSREFWHTDLDHARQHIAACGIDRRWLTRQVRVLVRALVREHWPTIERVAAALEQHGTLSGGEIDQLIA